MTSMLLALTTVISMKTEHLYPKYERDNFNRRWLVVYDNLSYFSEYKSWKSYHRTKTGARLAAWWSWSMGSNGVGTVTLHDTWEESND